MIPPQPRSALLFSAEQLFVFTSICRALFLFFPPFFACSTVLFDKKKDARPYSVKPRGAPTSAFLQEAARRAAEAREAAKVDPWQSDGEEEEERDAAIEEDEDSLRGERVHAWVSMDERDAGVSMNENGEGARERHYALQSKNS